MMKVYQSRIPVATQRAPEFVDLTDFVKETLRKTGVKSGRACIFSRHTTAGVVLSQAEPLLLKDQAEFLMRLAPIEADYQHDNFAIRTENLIAGEEDPNGHSHCQGLFVGISVDVPIVDGKLTLGQRQRVFLVELDSARKREVTVQIIGMPELT